MNIDESASGTWQGPRSGWERPSWGRFYYPTHYRAILRGPWNWAVWVCGHMHESATVAKNCAEEYLNSLPPDVSDARTVMVDRLTAERDFLQGQNTALRKALLEIKLGRQPQVCDEYDTCEHDGCAASYSAFVIADKALQEND